MATGPLRFRTPHIEELPVIHQKHAPGFSYVAVVGPQEDPSKNWGTTNRKRVKQSATGQTEQQKEALNARQQREVERKIRELNNDHSRADVAIPSSDTKGTSAGGPARAGRTTNTKKILSSGKTFAHYLDDEEAEIARTGRRDIDWDGSPAPVAQRASKTPIARRKPKEETSTAATPASGTATIGSVAAKRIAASILGTENISRENEDSDCDDRDSYPSVAELEALLNAPPLTFNQARSEHVFSKDTPPRHFCETCGYWGRVRCLRCGIRVCSVECKDIHDQSKCLKMYA